MQFIQSEKPICVSEGEDTFIVFGASFVHNLLFCTRVPPIYFAHESICRLVLASTRNKKREF